MRAAILSTALAAACGSSGAAATDAAGGADAPPADGVSSDGPAATGLGMVTKVTPLPSCPGSPPAGATCRKITVIGCPGIESEAIDATVAFLPAQGTLKGTVLHFSGGGGEGYQMGGAASYRAAGLQQVFVAWASDWEQTASLGIKAGACRPATVIQWAFSDPSVHAGSRTTAFCGEGFSGGSGQLGYALATYGMGQYFDYVNELSGPPFARIDLGCDGSQPATAQVCGATDTMRLPSMLQSWENVTTCGSATPPAADVAKWMADSISIGGTYSFPNTDVQFFDCTYNATAVTAMAQILYNQIAAAEGGTTNVGYHCYSQADGCMGEGLGTGNQDATNALIAGCVPRH